MKSKNLPGGMEPQQQSTEVTSAAGQPVPGSSFNRLFPSASGGYSLVYTQEKEGFAEAKLQQGSQDMAMLSISDTVTNPSAVQKFQQSNTRVAGYPSSSLTPNDTAILSGRSLSSENPISKSRLYRQRSRNLVAAIQSQRTPATEIIKIPRLKTKRSPIASLGTAKLPIHLISPTLGDSCEQNYLPVS